LDWLQLEEPFGGAAEADRPLLADQLAAAFWCWSHERGRMEAGFKLSEKC